MSTVSLPDLGQTLRSAAVLAAILTAGTFVPFVVAVAVGALVILTIVAVYVIRAQNDAAHIQAAHWARNPANPANYWYPKALTEGTVLIGTIVTQQDH